MNPTNLKYCSLSSIRLLSVTGSDAPEFLQAQLSRSVADLPPDASVLAGWHDARGRVRAVFRVLRDEQRFLLAAPADLAPALIKTLQMFVLRSDVHIEAADLACAGIVRGATSDPLQRELPQLPQLPEQINAVVRNGATSVVCVAPGCWQVFGPQADLKLESAAGEEAFIAAEIRAGIPHIDQHTTTQYVPHMLNLDKLDAIDFEKGCYPGQEVIARTEHLGSVKRRAQAYRCKPANPDEPAPPAATAVVDGDGESIGAIVRAARVSPEELLVLAVVTLSKSNDDVFLSASDGPQLSRLALPFE